MALRRQHHRKAPRGAWLAFLAVAVQAMLPFFIAVALVRATNPAYAGEIPVCSSLGSGAQHDSGAAGDQHASCPICAAVAAAQSLSATPAPQLPLPVASSRVSLSTPEVTRVFFHVAAPYQSRAPPVIA